MSVATDFFMIMGAIVVFLFMLMGIINWLSRGFWGTWLRIRISKGSKWLIRIWTPTGNYYRSGKPDGETIKYKDRNKHTRTIQISEGSTYKSFGCDCIETDETTNGVRVVDDDEDAKPSDAIRVKGAFYVVPGFDAVTFDSLIQRAYELGKSANQNKEKIMIFILVVVVIAVAIDIYMSYNMANQIATLLVQKNSGAVI